MLLTDVPDELGGRQIQHAELASGFVLSLDTAEPWGAGRIEGRVEARAGRHGANPVFLSIRCYAAWLEIAPQMVGQKRLLGLDTLWDVRTRSIPIWIEDEAWLERWELGSLGEGTNWLHFGIDLPPELPRAIEGTFVSFRWRVEARRDRRLGHDTTSLPLILCEPRTQPVVRVETSPLGSWRLLEWRAEDELDAAVGPCSIAFEERRPEDLPLPGESPQEERRRRGRY